MTMTYAAALEQALNALADGQSLEEALAGCPPQFTEELREDLAFTGAMSRANATLPQPSETARREASVRLMASLQRPAPMPVWRRWLQSLLTPRLAFGAAAVLAIAVLAAGMLGFGRGGTAEASVLEGVIIETQDGSITLQTLDTLEQIVVPADVAARDASGASIDPSRLAVGEVVVIRVRRVAGAITARSIDRVQGTLEDWCEDRCQRITDRLQEVEEGCQEGSALDCRRINIVCDRAPRLCPGDPPPTPTPTPVLDKRPVLAPDTSPATRVVPTATATPQRQAATATRVPPSATAVRDATQSRPEPTATKPRVTSTPRPTFTATRQRTPVRTP